MAKHYDVRHTVGPAQPEWSERNAIAGVLPPAAFTAALHEQHDQVVADVAEQWLTAVVDDSDHNGTSLQWAWKEGSDLPAMSAVDKTMLSMHPDPIVRGMMASLPNMPTGALMRLARDPSVVVRQLIAARTPSLPSDVACHLAYDQAPRVRLALTHHISLPAAAFTILTRDSCPAVRAQTAVHPDLPIDLLDRLVADDDDQVRAAVARRNDVPMRLRMALRDDPSREVRRLANHTH